MFKKIGLLATSLCIASMAHAAYPDRAITVLVPFAAGGPTDIIARVAAKGLGQHLQQSIVVENKPGAGGMIGIELLKRARPDGYTIGVATASTQGVAPNIYDSLNYDPLKDFNSIGAIVAAPGVMISNREKHPDCRLDTLVKTLQKQPGELTFGSAGVGSLSHMTGEQFQAVTQTSMLHIPYQGLAPAMNDLYGGQLDAIFDNVSTSLPHIQSGRVCALAVQSEQRLSSLPDVPTYAELGLDAMNTPTWYGLLAPANTPDELIRSLNAALQAALNDSETKDALEKLGVQVQLGSPEDFEQTQKREIQMWKDIVQNSGFEVIKR